MCKIEVYPERAEKLINLIGRVIHRESIVPFDSSDIHLYIKRKVVERKTKGLFSSLMAT
jgi:hypothetical protein